jgi:transposase
MRKYETKFKLKVVESFLAGDGGAKLLARRWSVPEEKIRTWVSHYRLHGVAGLQPKRSAYTADFKLQVLVHQDRERLSSRQIAAIYDIRNPNQVVVWRRAFDGGGTAALEGSRKAHSMKADKPNSEVPDTDSANSNRELREEVERLRAEVAHLKKLEALVRANRQAAQKKRKPFSN